MEYNFKDRSVSIDLTKEELCDFVKEHLTNNSYLMWAMAKNALEHLNARNMTNGLMCLERKFWLAHKNGLQRPKIRVCFNDVKWVIYESRAGNLCFKAGEAFENGGDKYRQAQYKGCILKGSAKWLQAKNYGRAIVLTDNEQQFLDRLNDDPVKFLADCGRGLGWCSYCGRRLEDNHSKLMGYGETCAKRWGLPYNKNSKMESDWLAEKTNDPLIPDGFDTPCSTSAWLVVADFWEEMGDNDKRDKIRLRVLELMQNAKH